MKTASKLEQLAKTFDHSATRRNAFSLSKTALRGQTAEQPALVTLAMVPGLSFTTIAGDRTRDEDSKVLIFKDDFDRNESQPGKEEIGHGWTSNSAWRAKGHQQVDLQDGVMTVTRHPEADHGVAIFHDVAFRNGRVDLKFKLRQGDDLGLDFVDRELKTVHAGHLCMARVTLNRLTLTDSKTGAMDNKLRERRLAGDNSPEITALLKTKTTAFPLKLKPETWYTLSVAVQGETMTAWIDGQQVGEFTSPGIGHPTKRMITLAVNQSAWVDDVEVWSLDPHQKNELSETTEETLPSGS